MTGMKKMEDEELSWAMAYHIDCLEKEYDYKEVEDDGR